MNTKSKFLQIWIAALMLSLVILACGCMALAVVWSAPVGRTYYVDSATGSDVKDDS